MVIKLLIQIIKGENMQNLVIERHTLIHKGHNRPHNIWTRMENHTIQHGPKPSHLKTTSWNRDHSIVVLPSVE